MRRVLSAGLALSGLWGCPNSDPPESTASPAAAVVGPEAEAPSDFPDWKAAFRFQVKGEPDAVVVEFRVQDGFHAYAEGETIGRPLDLTLEEGPVRLAGPVETPPGQPKDLPVGRSVTVEGTGRIRAPVTYEGDRATARGTFHYQVCTDEMCDRPRNHPFEVELRKDDGRRTDAASD